MSISYKEAGVDIDAGNDFVKEISPLAKSTSRLGSNVELGGFGGLFDLAACKFKDPVLVAANDGVGTKLKIAFETQIHNTVGIDLVAMCVNDLVVQGAEPLFFLDYLAVGKLENKVASSIIAGIVEGCKQSGAALLGGETAEMPGIYQKGHYDLAGFAVGAVERENIIDGSTVKSGDVLIGMKSNGLHSNGFSLVRHLIEKNSLNYSDKSPFDESKTLGESLLEPTKIYVKPILKLLSEVKVKAFAHITGGGFTENLPRVLPENLSAEIDCESFKVDEVFKWLAKLGNIETLEMLKTFNCSTGMVAVVSSGDVEKTISTLENEGVSSYVIGGINELNNNDKVTYKNIDKIYE